MKTIYNPISKEVKVTENHIEYASNNSTTATNDETHFYNGMDGSPVQAFAPTGINSIYKDVQFNNPIRPDDTLMLEFLIDGVWRDYSQLSMNRKSDSTTSPTVFVGCDTWTTTNIRRLRVNFYSKASETVTWASLVSPGYRWRVKKISGSNFAESVEVNKSVTVAGNYSISQGISTVNVNASTATIDLSSVLLNSKVLIRKISAYDGNAITINASGATFEGRASIELYGQYSYVELERISATVFAIKDLKDFTFRASSSFTLPSMPDGARKRILNTHATNAITVTAYSGTTIEGQATMTLSAGHEVEIELIGTDWRKVVLSQSATPSAGKAMVWTDGGMYSKSNYYQETGSILSGAEGVGNFSTTSGILVEGVTDMPAEGAYYITIKKWDINTISLEAWTLSPNPTIYRRMKSGVWGSWF